MTIRKITRHGSRSLKYAGIVHFKMLLLLCKGQLQWCLMCKDFKRMCLSGFSKLPDVASFPGGGLVFLFVFVWFWFFISNWLQNKLMQRGDRAKNLYHAYARGKDIAYHSLPLPLPLRGSFPLLTVLRAPFLKGSWQSNPVAKRSLKEIIGP